MIFQLVDCWLWSTSGAFACSLRKASHCPSELPVVALVLGWCWWRIVFSPETECPHWGHLMVIVTVWCLIVVLQLGPGMCLLSNVQVHFDCAGSRNVWAPVVGHGIFCWELSRKSSFRICFFYSSTAQTRSKLRRGSLAVSQGRRIRFLFFFDAGTEILSKIMYILFSLTVFPLSARVGEWDFCLFHRRGHRNFCRRLENKD